MSHKTVAAYLTAITLYLAAGADAQTASRVAFGPYLPDARTDSMLVVVELRDLAAIEYDRDVARTKRIGAKQREEVAGVFQSRASTTIKIKDTEISALKARIKQAKAEGNATMTKQYETERDHAEFEKQLLRRREQLRQSDISFAKAEVAYHDAAIKSYELELELARARSKRTGLDGGIPSQAGFETAWRLDKQIREMEGKTLDALQESANKQKNLAEQAVKIFKARKRVWEAQRDLIESVGGTKN